MRTFCLEEDGEGVVRVMGSTPGWKLRAIPAATRAPLSTSAIQTIIT